MPLGTHSASTRAKKLDSCKKNFCNLECNSLYWHKMTCAISAHMASPPVQKKTMLFCRREWWSQHFQVHSLAGNRSGMSCTDAKVTDTLNSHTRLTTIASSQEANFIAPPTHCESKSRGNAVGEREVHGCSQSRCKTSATWKILASAVENDKFSRTTTCNSPIDREASLRQPPHRGGGNSAYR